MELGAKVVAGSDGGWGVYPLGQFQHEITALADAGMRNADCVLALHPRGRGLHRHGPPRRHPRARQGRRRRGR